MPPSHDVIVIGGGHNGLVAATYLAKAGRRVLVLERRPIVGGAAVTEEFHPGFRAPTGATLAGLLRPEVVRDLALVSFGLERIPVDPEVVALGGDGRILRLWRDAGRSQGELSAFSGKDADAYPRFRTMMVEIGSVVDPLLVRTLPEITDVALGEQMFLLRRALRARKLGKEAMHTALRMAPMSLHDFLGEWFETDLLKATLAFEGLTGAYRGPWSPGTAFGLVHHFLPEANGDSWSFVKGGMGGLSDALASAAKGAGVAVRAGAEVRKILVQDGRAVGVELATGERIDARVVASSADPKRTFLGLVEPGELDPSFVLQMRNYQCTGVVSRVTLALDGLPRISGIGEGVSPARLRIAPSLEYIERAYDDAKYGRASADPVLDVLVPTLLDGSLAPSGKHVLSVLVQYTPYYLRRGTWDRNREKLGDRAVEILEARIPGIERLILHREVLTPVDLESRFGLTGGHIYHGEMGLNQQLFMRPAPGWARYRTPLAGLYLCGSGAHPGGGITGAPGYNAAREMLRDLARRAA